MLYVLSGGIITKKTAGAVCNSNLKVLYKGMMMEVNVMGKNILIITGSPRANGNSNTLAAAFAGGATAAGNTVEVLDACALNMDGCHGDASCHQRGCCGLKDDGVKLHEKMCWADVLVLVTPIYWKSFTSQIKKVVDRLYPFAAPKGRAQCTVKETYLIATANNPDPAVFGPIKEEFDLVNTLLQFECKGQLLCGGLGGPDAIDEHPEYVEAAVRLGVGIGGAKAEASAQQFSKELNYINKLRSRGL